MIKKKSVFVKKFVKSYKKASTDFSLDQFMPMLLMIIIFSILFFVVVKNSYEGINYEQIYSKKIALILDKSRPLTSFEMDISELYKYAQRNKFKGKVISIDSDTKTVNVKVSNSLGYSSKFFSDIKVKYDLNLENNKLIVEIL
jgi:hypothetical protein